MAHIERRSSDWLGFTTLVIAAVIFALGLNWIAGSSERNLEHNLKQANYTIVASYGQGTSLWYAVEVGDCHFWMRHNGPSDTMTAYRGEASQSKYASDNRLTYTGSTKKIGKPITGYTPETFKASPQYKKCLK